MEQGLPHLPKLPKRYQDALNLVRQILAAPKDTVSEFIAGGAIRDLILQRTQEDIDIFCFQAFDKIGMFEQISDLTLDDEGFHERSFYDEINDVQFFYDSDSEESSKVMQSNRVLLSMKGGYKIDVIMLLNGEGWDIFKTLDSFDLGFVKCAHSGTHYILHEDFIQDTINKTIRVCAKGAYGPDSIKQRLTKFKERFPDWTIDDSKLEKE